jgi:SAM-dependent methyltransferase
MKPLTLLFVLFLCSTIGLAQTRQEIESRISNMPPDERTFERFRAWIAGLPAEVRGSEGISTQRETPLLNRYRQYLKDGGFSTTEIEAQIDVVVQRGEELEYERWNRMYTAATPSFNTNANAFLVDVVTTAMKNGLKPGKALDVSMGQGRNAIWLAQQGWDVTGFDPARDGVNQANETAKKLGVKIHTEVTTDEKFDFGENRWDLILLSYAGCAALAPTVERALKPGGILIVEAFHTDALKTMKIGGSLCSTGELPHTFQGLRTVRYEEPIAKPDWAPSAARVVRFYAVKLMQ